MSTYFVDVILFQLGFLVLYEIVLRGSTYFQWNRCYLLLALTLSLVLPLIFIPPAFWGLNPAITSVGWLIQVQALQGLVLEGQGPVGETFHILKWAWILGIVFGTLKLLNKVLEIRNLISGGAERLGAPGYTLVVLPDSLAAFSFFKWIFIGDRHDRDAREIILRHEEVHVKQRHSLDLLFFGVFRVVFWFNPLNFWYRNRLVEIHEFQADAQAVCTDHKAYYFRLLAQAFQCPSSPFIHSFYKHSLIKKRIVMLRKKRSTSKSLRQFLWIFPLVFGMLLYISCKEETGGADWQADEAAAESQPVSATFKMISFREMDQVPVFPGCEDAEDQRSCFNEKVMRHIMKHFNYPEAAQKEGIQGQVSLIFTIDETGAISDIKTKGPDPLLEEEARRIIERLPAMQPGSHGGKTVSVPYSIPITFKLD